MEAARGVEAVLPLAPADLERFLSVLFPSLQTFGDFLSRLWIITPWRASSEIAATCRRLTPRGFVIEVLSELTVVPELVLGRKSSGWFRQQLVKLAIVDRIETDFYLTLDADVFCTRTCRTQDLIPDGRALLQREPVAIKEEWYEWSTRVLGLGKPRLGASVTPNMFSVEAVGLLREHLESRIATRWRLAGRAANRVGLPIRPWLAYLTRRLPWTEYTLYVTVLEASGMLDTYHRSTDVLAGNSVWSKDQFDSWDPEKSFGPEARSLFSVIQSNTGIAAGTVAGLVTPHFHRAGGDLESSTDGDPAQARRRSSPRTLGGAP